MLKHQLLDNSILLLVSIMLVPMLGCFIDRLQNIVQVSCSLAFTPLLRDET
jgi:hypothetical protein